ncbi:22403_t:CDS:2 [Cetraspora pellucida]|uniref:22403_t:CDS:1 n=1 Tax=Cetraspora pellucida TaxID=1433469 RepID=A0A9N9CXL7_9GLOM|nr:22403_t:CDS:2 [Cetraspora pellucida]
MALANASFSEILDDLSSRFIINVPEEELASVERICFQIEQAHWFYEDFVREQNPTFADFMQYKIRVPVCGAIMLNDTMDQCVLVKGWSSRSGWGFPKGKINKDELDSTCAAREVLEETGYDISPLIREQDYIELTIREQRIRLYIVVGVPEDTEFCPKTRKEISKVEWHKVSDLPTWIRSRDKDTPYHCGGGCVKYGSSRFYMVVPFVSKLRHWLKSQRKMVRKRITDESQQEESSEVVVFNGHGTDSGPKETSPETSVPGTESEGSPHEQSPTFSGKLHETSSNIHGTSQTIMRSMFSLDTPISTQISTFSTSLPQELQQLNAPDAGLNFEYNQMPASEFIQSHSYFSTSLPLGQSPSESYIANGLNFHQSTSSKIQSSSLSNLEGAKLHMPRRKSSIGSIYSNSHSHNHTTNSSDITAPVPINANSNAAIAALDPEQKLRRNSLLSLFTASTSTKQCDATTPISSVAVGHDDQHRNSLLSVLQSELPSTSNQIYPNPTSIPCDDITQPQTQQSLLHFLPSSYDQVNTDAMPNANVHTNTMFSMFQHSTAQRNQKGMTSHSSTIPDSNYLGNRRDSAFSRHSSQGIATPKLSTNVGPIGQGRPSNNNENNNPEIHEVARKMSLLGLFSTVYSSNSDKNTPNTCLTTSESPIKPQNTFFSSSTMNSQLGIPGTPSSLRVNKESLLRLITASPPPQGAPLSPKVFDAEIQAQERALLNLLKSSNPSNNGVVNENGSPDLRVRHELLDRIHAFIPPGGTNLKDGINSHALRPGNSDNPMVNFKFDVEKIVAAL